LDHVLERIHIIGFGGQGDAWAHCLKYSGWDVRIYLHRQGPSFERAQAQGHNPHHLTDLTQDLAKTPDPLIAMLCPDAEIGRIYRETVFPVSQPATIVLAHGFAVYAGQLRDLAPGHEVALLAPKAIGPKIRESHDHARPHKLVAGLSVSPKRAPLLQKLATGLGFDPNCLVPCTFDQETIGDLISEQSLLCGGVFPSLLWTMEEMAKAGVPDALIREECLTELELIASLIRTRGPATTLKTISDAARAGTAIMAERLETAGVREAISAQAATVTSRDFARAYASGGWKNRANRLIEALEAWERRLKR